MKCDEARVLFVDHLYEELGSEQEQHLQQHLQHCKDCSEDLNGLTETRQVLRVLPEAEPEERLIFTEKPVSSFSRLREQFGEVVSKLTPARIGYSLAGAAAAFLLVGSLTNLQIRYTDDAFSVSMSLWEQQEPTMETIPTALKDSLFAEFQRENAALVAQYIKQEQLRSQQQMNEILAAYAQKIENQRSQDLQLIGRSFDVMRETNNSRFSKYNDLLKSVNYQQK